MVHQSMRDDLAVADELYIQRVSLVLEDFLSFSLYSFSWISKASYDYETAFDSGLVLISSKLISSLLFCSLIPYYCYHYHLRPTSPVTLERVPYNVPDIECTGNIV